MTERQLVLFLNKYCDGNALRWDGFYNHYLESKRVGIKNNRLIMQIPYKSLDKFLELLGPQYIRDDIGLTVELTKKYVRLDVSHIFKHMGINLDKVFSKDVREHWSLG